MKILPPVFEKKFRREIHVTDHSTSIKRLVKATALP
jgi:hypothetical protein